MVLLWSYYDEGPRCLGAREPRSETYAQGLSPNETERLLALDEANQFSAAKKSSVGT